MARSKDATQVGLFVLAALFLGLGSAIFIGSLRLFSTKATYILYFTESINGLSVGAPVKYKGVPIGKVSDIKIRFNQSTISSAIPVFVEVDTDRLANEFGVVADIAQEEELARQIREGLRGKLQLDSFISGQLFIELDYVDDRRQYPAIFIQEEIVFLEIPTIPSAMARLGMETSDIFTQLSSIDFAGISRRLEGLLASLQNEVEALDLNETTQQIGSAAESFQRLVDSGELEKTLDQVRTTLASIESAANNADHLVGSIDGELGDLAKDLRSTLNEGQALLRDFSTWMDPESNSRQNIDQLVREWARATRQLRSFLEFLEQYPNALLGGRRGTEYVP